MSSEYLHRIRELHRQLGIGDDYAKEYGLPLQMEEKDLLDIGPEIYKRPLKIAVSIEKNWLEMRDSAMNNGIELLLVSAFRSVDYQANLIRKKIEKGIDLQQVLRASAAPGYSEHHTGRALDFTTDEVYGLSESFENTKAFHWLSENAMQYGFTLSYPKNPHRKIIFEPWHWACFDKTEDV